VDQVVLHGLDAYSEWSFNPQLKIKDLLEREGLRSESEVLT
jgi:hypothetical protein